MNENPTRKKVMKSPSVHNFVKDVLILSTEKDPVDLVHDIELIAIILKNECDEILSRGNHEQTQQA